MKTNMAIDDDRGLSSLADMIGDTARLGVAIVAINAMTSASCDNYSNQSATFHEGMLALATEMVVYGGLVYDALVHAEMKAVADIFLKELNDLRKTQAKYSEMHKKALQEAKEENWLWKLI